MELTVGSRVILLRDMMREKVGSIGFVVEEYPDFDKNGNGVSIIFQNGSFDGFSVNEQNLFLQNLGVDSRYERYPFEHVMKVNKDYRNGYWKFSE